ncbi:hypothetical protein NBRC116583_29270 [Arenicella sp. 4NH20-0111]|uniref:hypothetical protein n=1 Tax=Arenicella sp. 4NH20-0111 TaxID=3127648 RepID=UPI003108C56A
MIELIISLASGALGGNVAGKVLSKFDQGTLLNSILGILGGGVGGSILSSLTGGAVDAGSAASIGGILSSIASGGVGGGVLIAIVGVIRNALGK